MASSTLCSRSAALDIRENCWAFKTRQRIGSRQHVGTKCYHVIVMVRTQIQLTPGQIESLRQLSRSTGPADGRTDSRRNRSLSGKNPRPGKSDRIARAMKVVGRFSSGQTDVSRNHDKYLAEAFRGLSVFVDTSALLRDSRRRRRQTTRPRARPGWPCCRKERH